MRQEERAPLPAVVARNIGDKLYERRKLAALEVETLVQKLAAAGQLEEVYQIVDTLAQTYALASSQQHARKGGLLCLAAAAVGLASSRSDAAQSEQFLRRAVPPILASFTDQDSRVRYYALEALYNVAKSARPGILALFPEVFDALLRLCGDADVSVQNATAFTAALIKDCLAESPAFNFSEFVPTLEASLAVDSSGKRQFLLGWLSLMDSLPAADQCLLRALPNLLPGMLSMLDDAAPEVRQAADKLLRELALEVHESPGKTDVALVAAALAGQLGRVDEGGAALKLMALHWLHQLVDAAPSKLAPQLPAVLRATLACIDSAELDISRRATELDAKLLGSGSLLSKADTAALMEVAAKGLGASQEAARLSALRWAHVLLQRDTPAALQRVQPMLASLCEALSAASDVAVQETAAVLAVVAAQDEGYASVLSSVLDCFRGPTGSKLLQRRGAVIVEKLCGELGAMRVLSTLSLLLASDEDTAFGSIMVQALNLILLTSSQLQSARTLLQSALEDPEGALFFQALFRSFSLSSGAALSLSMLSQAYELASDLIGALARPPTSAAMSATVVEISQVVSLLEAPPFAFLRLQLLDPAEQPALLRALYSMLMLLPQGDAFRALQQRLRCVPVGGLVSRRAVNEPAPGNRTELVSASAMLEEFVQAQTRRLHEVFKE